MNDRTYNWNPPSPIGLESLQISKVKVHLLLWWSIHLLLCWSTYTKCGKLCPPFGADNIWFFGLSVTNLHWFSNSVTRGPNHYCTIDIICQEHYVAMNHMSSLSFKLFGLVTALYLQYRGYQFSTVKSMTTAAWVSWCKRRRTLLKIIQKEWREQMCKMDRIAAVVSTLRKGCKARYP